MTQEGWAKSRQQASHWCITILKVARCAFWLSLVNSRQQNGATIENAAFEDISNRAIAQARHIPLRANQALDALLGSIRKAAKNGRAGRIGAETKKGSDPWSKPPLARKRAMSAAYGQAAV